MKKGIWTGFILLFLLTFTYGCEKNGYDNCKSNSDCCSGYCDKTLDLEIGICLTACGRQVPKSTAGFPWYVGIYQRKESNLYDQICGGTLISPNVVVSAANCIASEGKRLGIMEVVDPALLKVAVGKHYRNFYHPEDASAQILDVQRMEVPPEYLGFIGRYAYDIALIILKTEIEYTRAVRPICLNFADIEQGIIWKLIGWGLNTKQDVNEKLLLSEMPLVTRGECINNIISPSAVFMTEDKLCAGNVSVCRIDIGGGLVVEDPATTLYYLAGVASLGPRDCKGNYTLFTKLSFHKNVLEKYAKNETKLSSLSNASDLLLPLKSEMNILNNQLTPTSSPAATCGRLISTTNITEKEIFPWHVTIFQHNPSLNQFDQICRGTLIAPTILITAAHCVADHSKFGKIGVIKSSTIKVKINSVLPDELINVENITIPSNYLGFKNHYANDIALITLQMKVEYSEDVQPICLKIDNDDVNDGSAGQIVADKQIINIPFIPTNECKNQFEESLVFMVTEDKICGGGNQHSNLCVTNRDYGGGLVFKDKKTEKYYLRGIVNLDTEECAGKDILLFTKLSSHKNFIKKYLLVSGLTEADAYNTGTCRPLTSEKLNIVCKTPVGHPTPCDRPLPDNSTAHFSCNLPEYMQIKAPEYDSIHCRNGQWDRTLVDNFCDFACGRAGSSVSNTEVDYGTFPWDALIFHYNTTTNKYDPYCGGTLISRKIVVSTVRCVLAHYFTRNFSVDASGFKIKLGNKNLTLDEKSAKDAVTQIVDVESIEFPGKYKKRTDYSNDITLHILKTEIVYTSAVKPVCLDVGNGKFKDEELKQGEVLKIPARTRPENNAKLDVIRKSVFMPRLECLSKLIGFTLDITKDRMCAQELPYSYFVGVDLGAGLVYENPENKTYFLTGVLSFIINIRDEHFTLNTKLSPYKWFLNKFLQEHEEKNEANSKRKLIDDGRFPWDAVVYHHDSTTGSYDPICRGTLISRKIVITAAHCVTVADTIDTKNSSLIRVAVGMNQRSLSTSNEPHAQISGVEKIDISPTYKPGPIFGTHDIAFLILKTNVEYTSAVRSVCLDIDKDEKESGTGKAVVWRKVEEAEELKIADMLSTHMEDCKREMDDSLISVDKICSRTDQLADCFSYNSGGGLVYQDAETKKYYLHGILNFDPKLCRQKPFALTTKLSSSKDFILKYLSESDEICQRGQCEPLFSEKLRIICSTPDDQSIKCNKPIPNNSTAKFFCNLPNYMKLRKPDYDTMNCQNGQWNRPLVDDFCEIACGRLASSVGGETPPVTFPWHAAVYVFNSSLGDYELRCAGTLISERIIVTVSHCVSLLVPGSQEIFTMAPSLFRVVLGRNETTSNKSDNTSLIQIIEVEKIENSPEFKGSVTFFLSDIAFLILKTRVKYTFVVRPVCLDIDEDNFEDRQVRKGVIGKMVAWKMNAPRGNRSEIIEMPFIPKEECLEALNNDELIIAASSDKFCAGGNMSITECGYREHGGGLVFQNAENKVYYLKGILAMYPDNCKEKPIAYFTQLSLYKELVNKYLKDCNGICTENYCEPLSSEKLSIVCFTSNGQITPCDKPLPAYSRANFSCNPLNYKKMKEPQYSSIICRNGKWDRPLLDNFCDLGCGRRISSPQADQTDFPWIVGIYERANDTKLKFISAGTLVSPKVVITTASAVVREEPKRKIFIKNPADLKIFLGKYTDVYNGSTGPLAQVLDVESIEIPPEFTGEASLYENDISFIKLTTEVNYTSAVQPVCLDLTDSGFEPSGTIGEIGTAMGWRMRQGSVHTEPRESGTNTTVLTRDQCLTVLKGKYSFYLTRDKICAAVSVKSDATKCEGGGLVVKNPKTQLYELHGITVMSTEKECLGSQFFTKLSSHRELVKRYLSESKTACGRSLVDPDEAFPWHVGIYRRNAETGLYHQYCGGTLVSLNVVITAGRCVSVMSEFKPVRTESPSNVKIVLEKFYSSFNASEEISGQVLDVESMEIPPEFFRVTTYPSDIAVIKLKAEVKYNAVVSPVCVNFREDDFGNQTTGWKLVQGKMNKNAPKVTETSLLSTDECRAALRRRDSRFVTDDKMCGKTNTSIDQLRCDGGGLLFLDPDTKAYFLRGVFTSSFFKDCQGIQYFTKLSSHRQLIRKYLIDCLGGACERTCGKPINIAYRPYVSNGKPIEYGAFPWHAGLYERNEDGKSYDQICGGTLISRKVVISAAHCVTEPESRGRKAKTKNPSGYKVAVGKYHRALNVPEDVLAQIVDIEHIEVPAKYRGALNLYDYDIAFIKLKEGVEYNWAVGPVCLDIGTENFEEKQMKKGAAAKVVGWGLTHEGRSSDVLLLAELPYVPYDECIGNISNTLVSFASVRDKICAGDKYSNVSVCQGDSGGGLVFEYQETKQYYLRGVVSLGPKGCKGEEYTLFTKLSSHKELVKKYIKLP